MKRGDIVIAAPHAGIAAAKNRPVLIVQADYYNARIHNVLVARSPAISPAKATGHITSLKSRLRKVSKPGFTKIRWSPA
jgi:mRNA-degrading endonuclease toxin of MazEF toxin-antitoxin module